MMSNVGLLRAAVLGIVFVAAGKLATAQEIRVTLLGTGTPILNINRFGMSTLVEAGNEKLLFDAGRGVAIRLHQRRVPLRSISALFLTHLHSDHISGLPDVYAMAPLPVEDGRRKQPLEVWGPDGVDGMAASLPVFFAQSNKFRIEGGELDKRMVEVVSHTIREGAVYDRDGVKVTAFLVDHGEVKPAYGYRVDYMGHSVVLSGDTTYTPNLIRHAKGAELLIHCIAVGSRALEKAAPEYVARFYRYLANPETVGRVLNEVKPKLAVFSHISLYSRGDIPRATEEEINTRVRAIYSGEFILGQDLMEFTVSDRGVTAEPYDPAIRNREP